MPPENENENETGTGTGGESIAELRRKLETAQTRIRDLNEESRGHRLNAANYKSETADLRTRLDKAIADSNTAIEAAKGEKETAIAALRAELNGQLESTRTELTGKATEAETKAAELAAKAKQRAIMADLKVAAKDAGMVDLDGLKLLDMSALAVNDDGDVTNATEIMAKLKEGKPFLFGSVASTSNTATTPPPATLPATKKAAEMTDEEYKAARALAAKGRLPATA